MCCVLQPSSKLGQVFLVVSDNDRLFYTFWWKCSRRFYKLRDVIHSILWAFVRELKIWRQQRQQQRHKSMIWLVEWRKIIVLHVRHAFWCNVLTWSAKRRGEIFIFEVLTTTGARSSKSFLLCLYTKTICAKQPKVHSAYFVQRDQHGIIARDLTQSSILMRRFPCSGRRSFLSSLLSCLLLCMSYKLRNGEEYSTTTSPPTLRGVTFLYRGTLRSVSPISFMHPILGEMTWN